MLVEDEVAESVGVDRVEDMSDILQVSGNCQKVRTVIIHSK